LKMTTFAFPASLSALSTPRSIPSFSLPQLNTLASPISTSNSATEQKKPRKNRSAYTLFALDIKPKLKASSSFKMSCVDLQTTISQLWKNLSSEERKKYQDQANEEKLHYMLKLKKFYENATPETIEEATKPKPKRPYSAYCYFVKEIRQVINLPDTKFKMQEILKQASEKWRMLSEEEKAVYQEKAKQAKEAYTAETTDDSETSESVKPEVESDHSEKNVKLSKKKTQKHTLNKKRGIHFPKEIQEKMDQVEKTATKKIKTDPLTDLRVQLGIARMSPLLSTENSAMKIEDSIKKPLIFSEKSSEPGVKLETIEDTLLKNPGKMQVEQTWPLFTQRQIGATANNATLTQAWPVNAPLVNQNLAIAREMSLMMGYEQMRRMMLGQMILNNMTNNLTLGCSLPLDAKIEVKAESH